MYVRRSKEPSSIDHVQLQSQDGQANGQAKWAVKMAGKMKLVYSV